MDNLLKGLIAVTCIAILAGVGWYFTAQWIAYNQAAESRSQIRAAVAATLDAATCRNVLLPIFKGMDDGSIKSRFDVRREERLKAIICVERIPLYDFEKSEANRLAFASFISG